MKRRCAALAAALILLALPAACLARRDHAFEAKVEFVTHRKTMAEDPQKQTEQRIVETFKKALGPQLDLCAFDFNLFEARLPARQGGVLIEVRGGLELRPAVEQAVRNVTKMEAPLPVRLVRQNVRVQRREEAVEEGQAHLNPDNWEKAWKKSVDRLQERLRRTVERRIYDAFARRGAAGWHEDASEASPGEEGIEEGAGDTAKLARAFGKRGTRVRVRSRRGSQDGAGGPRAGQLKLLVDKEHRKVVRLLAYDAKLGLILTQLAAQVPVNYVLTTPRLTHYGVSLCVADCSVPQALEALAAAAGGKIERKDGIHYFLAK